MFKKNRLSRTITFANSAVTIGYTGSREANIINFLYRYLPNEVACTPHTRFWLSIDDNGYFGLFRDEALVHKVREEAIIAERLLGDSCYHLADKSSKGLLFHAAVVGWQNQGILLPGASGAGKSTLTAWLLNQGFTYLTDELAFVPHNSLFLHAFTRPLNLKQPSWNVIQPLLINPQAKQIMSGPRTRLISPTLFNSNTPRSSISPRLIIFPQYQRDGLFEWCKLSAAQAGLALMKCLINARNLPGHGFAQVARLARAVPAYTMRYADFEQLDHHFERVLHRGVNNCSV